MPLATSHSLVASASKELLCMVNMVSMLVWLGVFFLNDGTKVRAVAAWKVYAGNRRENMWEGHTFEKNLEHDA